MRLRLAALACLPMLLLAGSVCGADTTQRRPLAWRGEPMPKLHGLIFNQDCTDFFYTNAIREGMDAGAMTDGYFGVLADAGVTVLMINTNARKVNYRSEVWESFWDGYDPAGPDDQPYFNGMAPGDVPGYRNMVHTMMELERQGVDYPARVAALCRERGVSPWISLRMNDVHYNDNLDNPFHGALWRRPELFRDTGGYYARALDYAHPEVRDTYRDLILETLRRYDIDGLELDFMREPYLFRDGEEEAGAAILREWLRGVRRLVYDESVRRGHPIYLGVRVPSRIEVAQSWGLDAVGWAKDGLVDLVVATPRWATLEYDMPLDEWAQALQGTDVTLAGGLEILHRPLPSGNPTSVTKVQAAGAAASVLFAGADVVYLFNYFSPIANSPNWTPEGYRQTLRAMHSLDALNALPRRHAITWRDIIGHGEAYTPPLPATGKTLSFELPTGPKPPEGSTVTLELRLVQAAEAPPALVTVNGAACELSSTRPDGEGVILATYAVPPSALQGARRDAIEIRAPGDASLTVSGVEMAIEP